MRHWLVAWLLGAPMATILSTPVVAQEAGISVRADTAAGLRPLLRVGAILDNKTLREATASGIPVRVNVRIELWRDGFFDDLAGSRSWNTALLYEPLARRYIVHAVGSDTPPIQFDDYDSARRAVEGERLIDLRPRRTGKYYYTATLVIETLSLSDVQELERWLQGELQPAVSGDRSLPGALGQGVKRLTIRLLRLPTRRLEARSSSFEVSSLGDSQDRP
jgi:hypothetical protein